MNNPTNDTATASALGAAAGLWIFCAALLAPLCAAVAACVWLAWPPRSAAAFATLAVLVWLAASVRATAKAIALKWGSFDGLRKRVESGAPLFGATRPTVTVQGSPDAVDAAVRAIVNDAARSPSTPVN